MQLPKDLLNVVGKEKMVWADKPLFTPFILKRLPALIFPLLFMLFPLLIFWGTGAPINPIVILFFMFWYGFLFFIVFTIIVYPILVWRNLFYVLTEKRIIIRKGIIGIDFDILKLELIQQINVNVGIIDRAYGTGSLIIQAMGVQPLIIENVKNPLIVREKLEKLLEKKTNSGF
ncbi:MAG: hypothetical protein DRJ44_01220 [Thermoprotei archaeon]|nr:MAG: hypothetical protein DRJ44_01220 [Thermoprotei archaeon]